MTIVQGSKIFHLGKRKFLFKSAWGWDMLIPMRVIQSILTMTNNYRYVITAYNSNNSDDDDTDTVMNELLGGQMVWNALGTLIEKLIYCQATEGAATQTTGDKCI